MRRLSKPRPLVGSLTAAVLALLPLILLALWKHGSISEGMAHLNKIDASLLRHAGTVLAISPYLYIAAVPLCFFAAQMLIGLGLSKLLHFLAGTLGICILASIFLTLLFGGKGFSMHTAFGVFGTILAITGLSAFPAAISYWYLVIHPEMEELEEMVHPHHQPQQS
ncbi:hypothetical protein ACMYR3_04635 [Ampullimonas aquatilis]|uniref:hypothetical protein n=1 Tax=Ampullimonas aquatilis TaxID=1341549 RepID=UPI003C706F16